jgi:AP-3 complex subunit delta-1
MPYSSIILKCVDDPDSSIRTRALELLEGMVDRSNLQAIVKKLLTHLQPPAPSAQDALTQLATGSASIATMANPEYKASLISRILRITTHASYAHISNFNWYVDLLVQLARLAISLPSTSTSTDTALEGQVSNVLIDVCARVRALRPYAISQCLTILLPERLLLVASAWIVGEYAVEGIDWKRASLVLREADCLYAAVKVLARWSANLDASEGYLEPEQLEEFRRSAEAIKEDPGIAAVRLICSKQLVLRAKQWPEVASLLEVVLANLAVTARPPPAPRFSSEDNPFASQDEQQDEPEGSTAPLGLKLLPAVIFPYELNPVNERAQSLVEVPEDLDLDTWLNPGSIPPLPAYEAAEGDVDEFGRPRGGFGMDSSVPVQVLVPKKSKKSKVEGQEDGKKKKKVRATESY